MKASIKLILILLSIALFLYICFSAARMLTGSNIIEDTPPATVEPTPNPEYTQQQIRLDFPDRTFVSGNVTISVDKFLNNGVTFADPANEGGYILAGDLGYCLSDGSCPGNASQTSDSFMVSYSPVDSYFSIILLDTQVATARREVEQFLLSTLGVSQGQLCGLNYSMTVPMYVDSAYTGQPLLFSFCPGSAVLN